MEIREWGRERWDHSSGQLSGLLRAFKQGASLWGWRGSLSGWFASRWVLWLAGCFFEMGIFEPDASAIIKLKVRPQILWGNISSVQFSCSVVSNSLQNHESQHARPPLSITNSQSSLKLMSIESVMPSSISSSLVPFSSCLQSFPVSGSFPMSQSFVSGGQSIGASASESVLPMNIQD